MERNREAEAKGDAFAMLQALVNEFPGLVDGDTEVNGADLVDALTHGISDSASLAMILRLSII